MGICCTNATSCSGEISIQFAMHWIIIVSIQIIVYSSQFLRVHSSVF